ncbi:GNAT family N-acetyltransferase [Erythrobacter sp. THAF29]|uniref:GNAT family N-acetyltransferase n=1 Tax=Erythrobacter sp. THAF29 TaxID=2587851 RepID=UPI0012697341|nr:GNAT family N-acetyltransferase [Erythrobacter sp. THAF29]QFT78876.1 ribosomal-protein-alanine N-acetyltransferase [Erythrobacter sp. THAF29]
MEFKILSTRADLYPYVDEIRIAADSERDSFGFLPPAAYLEFVEQQRAVIAVDQQGRLAGYCLYGGVLPEAKIFQTYVAPQFRGEAVGKKLLGTVFGRLEQRGFLSVVANVAEDLKEANRFYEKAGFDVVNTKAGGKSKKRKINIRARELSTPNLFSFVQGVAVNQPGLAIHFGRTQHAPRYVLDLNVIFDVTKSRPRSEVAKRVIGASLENDIKLAISEEILAELERHTRPGSPDPTLEFCRSIPMLKLPAPQVLSAICSRLHPLVFPEKANQHTLKSNDIADLRHLATAIEERAAGFITSDKAILRAADALESEYGLSILSPSTFGQSFESEFGAPPRLSVQTESSRFEALGFSEDYRQEVDALLDRFSLSDAVRREVLAGGTVSAPRRRVLIRSPEGVVCFASWDCPTATSSERELHLYADEGHPDAQLCIRHSIQTACRDVGHSAFAVLRLRPQINQRLLQKVAISSHFHADRSRNQDDRVLRKISIGRLLLPGDWKVLAEGIRTATGVSIEGTGASGPDWPLNIVDASGRERRVGLEEFEDLFGPTLVYTNQRPAILQPIRPSYAEELFGGGVQPSFLDHRKAAIKFEKAYIGGSYPVIPDGGLIFFYESGKEGGRKAVIAVARILGRYTIPREEADAVSMDRGVVPTSEIRREGGRRLKTLIDIDTIMLFKDIVPKSRLSELGCWDGANLVTTKAITPKAAHSLLSEGRPTLGK